MYQMYQKYILGIAFGRGGIWRMAAANLRLPTGDFLTSPMIIGLYLSELSQAIKKKYT